MLIVLIPFLEWPEQSQDDTFRFLDFFFFSLGLQLLSLHYKAKMEFNAL